MMKAQGAILVPLERLDAGVPDEAYEGYNEAIFSEVKQQLEDYLAGREGLPVKSLAELIAFIKRTQKPDEPDQKLLEMINELETTPQKREVLWEAILPVFQKTIDDPLKEHKLDAMVSNFLTHNYFYSAAAGYPGISVPSGMDDEGMPTAIYVYGSGKSEATLLSVAHGYEQASQAIQEPAFLPGAPSTQTPDSPDKTVEATNG